MTRLPEDASPVGDFACPRGDGVFARESHLALHLHRAHGETTPPLAAALAFEHAWMTEFRRRARAGMAILPVALLYVAVVLVVMGSGLSLFWAALLLPGVLGFGALVAFIAYERPPKA